MNPKTNSILMLVIFAFGCFIGNRFKNDQTPPTMSQQQDQKQDQAMNQESSQDCSVEVGKKTNPDGSIEEFFRLRALNNAKQGMNQAQAQTQKQEIKPQASTIDIFGGAGASSKIQGWGAVEVVLSNKHSFEYVSNGSEWIGFYKVKILSF
jgi:hypothetical protein